MDKLTQLFESALLNDESRQVIREAFENAVKAKEVELTADFQVKLAESEQEIMKQLPAMVEEALSEELAVIAEEVAHARTLEVQYADKLNVFKEQYDLKQQEQVSVMVAEAVAEEFEELKEDIELAKRHEFVMSMFESFRTTYESLFGGVDAKAIADLKESKAELDKYKRTEKLNALLECVTGEKRAIAETILEGVETDKLESKFESIRGILLAEAAPVAVVEQIDESAASKEIAGKVIVESDEGVDEKTQAALADKIRKSLQLAKR